MQNTERYGISEKGLCLQTFENFRIYVRNDMRY
jgi:hypothetical protein